MCGQIKSVKIAIEMQRREETAESKSKDGVQCTKRTEAQKAAKRRDNVATSSGGSRPTRYTGVGPVPGFGPKIRMGSGRQGHLPVTATDKWLSTYRTLRA